MLANLRETQGSCNNVAKHNTLHQAYSNVCSRHTDVHGIVFVGLQQGMQSERDASAFYADFGCSTDCTLLLHQFAHQSAFGCLSRRVHVSCKLALRLPAQSKTTVSNKGVELLQQGHEEIYCRFTSDNRKAVWDLEVATT